MEKLFPVLTRSTAKRPFIAPIYAADRAIKALRDQHRGVRTNFVADGPGRYDKSAIGTGRSRGPAKSRPSSSAEAMGDANRLTGNSELDLDRKWAKAGRRGTNATPISRWKARPETKENAAVYWLRRRRMDLGKVRSRLLQCNPRCPIRGKSHHPPQEHDCVAGTVSHRDLANSRRTPTPQVGTGG